MLRLSGKPISGGSALGTAAVVRWVGGIAQLPPRILEEMALVARKGTNEPIDAILIAEDYARAAGLTIPGVRVVGIIAEREEGTGGGFPALVGVDQATTRIADDVLVLLDADRALALVDPDGMTVAAYQAEIERISPRRRIYIDYAHEPARTLDGRMVRVSGVAVTEAAAAAAVEAGADGIVVMAGHADFASSPDDSDQRDAMVRLFRSAGGKPVVVVADLEALSLGALLQAAKTADVTLALPLDFGVDGIRQAREYIEEAGRELTAAEVDWSPIRFAGVVAPALGEPAADEELPLDRLLIDLSGEWEVGGDDQLEWVREWAEAAARVMAPVEIVLPENSLDSVAHLVAAGASGVAVAGGEVQSAKQIVREIPVF